MEKIWILQAAAGAFIFGGAGLAFGLIAALHKKRCNTKLNGCSSCAAANCGSRIPTDKTENAKG